MSQTARLYLVDTSALVRADHPQVRYTLTTLITDRVAASCVTVDLAAGYSGRNVADLTAIEMRRRERYVTLPIDEACADRAREVQLLMAGTGVHRGVGILDLLTAAIAERHDAMLLHYDASFEAIGAITGQPHLWVAPRGSLESAAEEPAPAPAFPAPAPVAVEVSDPGKPVGLPPIDEFLAAKRARDRADESGVGPGTFEPPDPVADAWYAGDRPER